MNPVFVAILAVILAILGIMLVFRFGKYMFHVLIVISLLGIVSIIVFASFLFSDASNFRDGISKETNLLLLKDNTTLLSVVVFKPSATKSGIDIYEEKLVNATGGLGLSKKLSSEEFTGLNLPLTFLSGSKFNNYKTSFSESGVANLSVSFYKAFIFEVSIFNEIKNSTIYIGEIELEVNDVLEALESDSILTSISEDLAIKGGVRDDYMKDQLEENFEDPEELRGALFALLLKKLVGDEVRVSTLVTSFQDGSLIVYPETIFLKVLKNVPPSFVEKMIERYGGE